MTPDPGATRPCRACLHWKRRGPISGDCYEPTKETTPWPVNEHDTCTFHQPKVIEVKNGTLDHA